MARMHSRKKGTAGSTKPSVKTKPLWLRYKEAEIELLVVKLAKEGKSSSEIGILLRDSYGIPDVKTITKKSIGKILTEKKLLPEIPEDLMAVMRKLVKIEQHRELNKQDKASLRGLQLTESKIKRLIKYYKKTDKLPKDWKFDAKKARLFIE